MNKIMNFEQELKILLSSHSSIIYITTSEETRLEYIINNISKKLFNNSIYSWDLINGYTNNPNNIQETARNPLAALEVCKSLNSKTPKIFLLKDYHLFLNEPSIIRTIKNTTTWLKNSNCYIIISATTVKIPPMLYEHMYIMSFPLPNSKEIEIELKRLFDIMKIEDNEYIENIKYAYKGFSINQIRQSFSKIILSKISLEHSLKQIEYEKKQIIQQEDILDFYASNKNLNTIGGLKYLKRWLKKRNNAFSKKAKAYGLPSPKGILLVGIQGTGKSLSAKAISTEWKLPLFKLDIGKIFAGIIGESEQRIRKAINLSEKCAPCIIWIDEIDKAFAKYNNSNDSGTTNRVMGSLLTWLAEKNKDIFIVATANNLLDLPPELIRKGRFDEIFFLDLPKFEERLQIFQIHLQKIRPFTWFNYDIKYFSKITENFSGAEIEQIIIEAMYNGFNQNREFTSQDIIESSKSLIPLAFTYQEQINQLQEWVYSGKIRIA